MLSEGIELRGDLLNAKSSVTQFPRNTTNLLSIHAANPSSRRVESISLRKVW